MTWESIAKFTSLFSGKLFVPLRIITGGTDQFHVSYRVPEGLQWIHSNQILFWNLGINIYILHTHSNMTSRRKIIFIKLKGKLYFLLSVIFKIILGHLACSNNWWCQQHVIFLKIKLGYWCAFANVSKFNMLDCGKMLENYIFKPLKKSEWKFYTLR